MSEFKDRKAGALLGSFVAEALSLGVHWIYDPEQLRAKFGYVRDYHDPGEESYHPKKQAGDQGHVGDQALVLLDSLRQQQSWTPAAFVSIWRESWFSYNDYFDHATKIVLENLERGASPLDAASSSEELAGPARMAPLVVFMAMEPEDSVVNACVEQTKLTHASWEADQTAGFLASASYRLLHGANLETTVRDLAPAWALTKADSEFDNNAVNAVGNLGRSCSIKAALPAVLYLVLKHGQDLEKAFCENAMAGGDNCARGLALGLLLGAHHGLKAIPSHLVDGLSNRSKIESLLS